MQPGSVSCTSAWIREEPNGRLGIHLHVNDRRRFRDYERVSSLRPVWPFYWPDEIMSNMSTIRPRAKRERNVDATARVLAPWGYADRLPDAA